jgi:hypothetical protein
MVALRKIASHCNQNFLSVLKENQKECEHFSMYSSGRNCFHRAGKDSVPTVPFVTDRRTVKDNHFFFFFMNFSDNNKNTIIIIMIRCCQQHR